MDTDAPLPKQNNYRGILDKPLAANQRKIVVAMLTAKSVGEAKEDSGSSYKHIQETVQNPLLNGGIVHAITEKERKLSKLIGFLEDIIDREAETPLKYSDKIAAAKLLADIEGVGEKKGGDTYNVGILDLREATEEQLVKELQEHEERKLRERAIDVEVVQKDSTTP